MPYVRRSFFSGESFVDISDVQRRAETWCSETAGLRVHGTTVLRPAEHFRAVEALCLLPAPVLPYDLPIYAKPKVHRDHHIEVAKALYSMPTAFIGNVVDARADRQLVLVYFQGSLVKTHPRKPPGGRSTDSTDLPPEKTAYAMRDLTRLQQMADDAGAAIGAFAAVVLDTPLPWTRMRQVYALLGLVKKWGPDKVDDVCRRAADAEAYSVSLLTRMLEHGSEEPRELPQQGALVTGRFIRPAEDFRVVPAKDPGQLVEQPRDRGGEDVTAGGSR